MGHYFTIWGVVGWIFLTAAIIVFSIYLGRTAGLWISRRMHLHKDERVACILVSMLVIFAILLYKANGLYASLLPPKDAKVQIQMFDNRIFFLKEKEDIVETSGQPFWNDDPSPYAAYVQLAPPVQHDCYMEIHKGKNLLATCYDDDTGHLAGGFYEIKIYNIKTKKLLSTNKIATDWSK